VAAELLPSAAARSTLRAALDEADLAAALRGVHLLGVRSKTQVTADVLAGQRELAAVGAFCIGSNHIDLGAVAAEIIAWSGGWGS
jgi:D-3-phosphoglycerate dehydrogenase